MVDQDVRDASFIASDYRANFKNVIAKRSDLAEFAGGRMVSPSSDTVYEAGTVLGQVTASGKWKPYASTATDGSEVAKGVLAESTLADAAGNGTKVSIIMGGTLFADMLIGMDSTALTALKAKAYAENGVNLVKIG